MKWVPGVDLEMSGFGNRVVSGEVGDLQYEGRGQSEQTYWPVNIEQ